MVRGAGDLFRIGSLTLPATPDGNTQGEEKPVIVKLESAALWRDSLEMTG